MPREKFKTLTQQMFYILLCLKSECYGMDIMEKVKNLTDSEVIIGAGTLYNLLEDFKSAEIIKETKVEGRKRSYIITQKGEELLKNEYDRIVKQAEVYKFCYSYAV